MGSVYRAMDENLGVEVAVKENLFTTDEYARQFRLEAVILASLRHPHLPRVTDHFVIDNQGQYLVMDYIEGEDLRQRMERTNTIGEEEAVLIGAAVCDALGYLHTRKPPILHRDIKPGNIKITPEGSVYLVDFGLAKLVQGSQTTTTGARAMTPGYSPPEQYGTARTDPRSDIYSLGATLYAALTGVIPEDGLARVMDNVQLTPIRKHTPSISRRLASSIEKAMEAYPDDRYQVAEEFRRTLLSSTSRTQRLVDLDLNMNVTPPPSSDIPTENQPDSSNTPAGRLAGSIIDSVTSVTTRMRRRTRKLLAAGGWIGILIVLLLSWFAWSGNANLTSALVAILPPSVVETYMPDAVRTATAEPIIFPDPLDSEPTPTQTTVPTPASTPTNTPEPTSTSTPVGGGLGQLAFVSNRTGVPQIYLINADGSGLRPITNEQDGACQPDWSPDGTKLVYVSPCPDKRDTYQGSSLYVINVDGSARVALPTSLGGDFEPDWSPNGKVIAFTSFRDGFMEVYGLNLETSQVFRLTDARAVSASAYARQPAWSTYGNQLAYVMRRAGMTQIWITTDAPITVKKPNEQLVTTSNTTNDFLPVWSPGDEFIVFNETNADGTSPAWLMRIRYEDRLTKTAVRVEIEPLPVVDVSFSPDGFWIAFESWPDTTNHDIYIATVTGANRRRLTTDPGFDFDPVWRPVPFVSP
jgi:serine/threonine protein kinase